MITRLTSNDKNSYEVLLKKYPKLVIFLSSIAYIAVILMFFKSTFYVNDDPAILNFITEGFPVLFMSKTLGYFLSFLYIKISSTIPWYGLYFYLFHIIILYLVIASLYELSENQTNFFISVGVFLVLFTPFIVSITYTITALMIGTAALIYFSMNLKKEIKISDALLLGILFAHSYLFRTDAVIAIIVFSFPFLVYLTIKFKNKLKHIFLFFTPLIFIIVSNTVISNHFPSPDHKAYEEFNTVRGKFHGFPVSDANIDNKVILENNNWSKNDYLMLAGWMHWDESKYNIETLSSIFTYSVNLNEKNMALVNIYEAQKHIVNSYKYYIIILFILMAYALSKRNKRLSFLVVLNVAYFLGGAFTFELLYRFPERIGMPIFVLSIFIVLYLIKDQKGVSQFNLENKAICIFVILIVVILQKHTIPRIEESERSLERSYLMLDYIKTNYSNFVFVNQVGECFDSLMISPLDEFKNTIKIIDGGWPIFSPYFYFNLEKIGLKKGEDIYLFLLNNDNVLFAGQEASVQLLTKHIEEKYGIKCNSVLVDDLKLFKLFKIKSKKNQPCYTNKKYSNNNDCPINVEILRR